MLKGNYIPFTASAEETLLLHLEYFRSRSDIHFQIFFHHL